MTLPGDDRDDEKVLRMTIACKMEIVYAWRGRDEWVVEMREDGRDLMMVRDGFRAMRHEPRGHEI